MSRFIIVEVDLTEFVPFLKLRRPSVSGIQRMRTLLSGLGQNDGWRKRGYFSFFRNNSRWRFAWSFSTLQIGSLPETQPSMSAAKKKKNFRIAWLWIVYGAHRHAPSLELMELDCFGGFFWGRPMICYSSWRLIWSGEILTADSNSKHNSAFKNSHSDSIYDTVCSLKLECSLVKMLDNLHLMLRREPHVIDVSLVSTLFEIHASNIFRLSRKVINVIDKIIRNELRSRQIKDPSLQESVIVSKWKIMCLRHCCIYNKSLAEMLLRKLWSPWQKLENWYTSKKYHIHQRQKALCFFWPPSCQGDYEIKTVESCSISIPGTENCFFRSEW